ncbi:MAG TPA: hypothetical protein VNM72_10380 [Blastocatellia bacterium]|nr:hypothetical protein [Blastocatellia bacterium]
MSLTRLSIRKIAAEDKSVGRSLKEEILEKLDQLPEPALQQVRDFLEFLSREVLLQEDPVLAVAGIFSGDSLSAEEIERELYGDGTETP